MYFVVFFTSALACQCKRKTLTFFIALCLSLYWCFHSTAQAAQFCPAINAESFLAELKRDSLTLSVCLHNIGWNTS